MKPRPHRRGFFVDAVIFDLGGVLVDWDPRHLYRTLFEDEAAMEDFLANVCTPAWHNRLDGGESFAAAIAALGRDFPERRALIEAYDSGWPRMFKGPITGTVAVLERLAAAGLPLYAITNFPAEKYDAFTEAFPFMGYFRDVLVSGREGLTKPDPEIFHRAARRFAVTPARTLFIDDRADNIAAARALGFQTHHFQTPEGLEQALAITVRPEEPR